MSTEHPAGMGLRERKKFATRQALSVAALRLAVQRGLEHVRVEDIAAEAGVSARTFNNYFSSKEEAIVSLGVDRAARIAAALRARPASEPLPVAVGRAFVEQYGGDAEPDREWVARLRLVISSPALRGEYLKTLASTERLLAEAIAERTGADVERDLYPRVLAAAVSGAARAALMHWLELGATTTFAPVLRQAIEQVVPGSAPAAENEERHMSDVEAGLRKVMGGGPSDTARTGDPPGSGRARRAEEFDAFYSRTPPWDIGRPQPAFLALVEAGAVRGRVLDVGCGTGEHVLMAAGLGLEATGVDVAAAAIALAEGKARDRGLRARFLVWDALRLASLGEQFDTVLDCGLFHVFEDDERPLFVDSLRAVTRPGGRYFLLCFSDRQPGTLGPRRVTRDEIRASFAKGWQLDSIEPATIDLAISPTGARAWLAAMTRT